MRNWLGELTNCPMHAPGTTAYVHTRARVHIDDVRPAASERLLDLLAGRVLKEGVNGRLVSISTTNDRSALAWRRYTCLARVAARGPEHGGPVTVPPGGPPRHRSPAGPGRRSPAAGIPLLVRRVEVAVRHPDNGASTMGRPSRAKGLQPLRQCADRSDLGNVVRSPASPRRLAVSCHL